MTDFVFISSAYPESVGTPLAHSTAITAVPLCLTQAGEGLVMQEAIVVTTHSFITAIVTQSADRHAILPLWSLPLVDRTHHSI